MIKTDQSTKTALDAARFIGCELNQIAKSIIFKSHLTNELYLFLTAGGNHVNLKKAADLIGKQLEKADPKLIRDITGFAIGGVSPIGHMTPLMTFWDETLFKFHDIWAAAGTPNHLFKTDPCALFLKMGGVPADFTQPIP